MTEVKQVDPVQKDLPESESDEITLIPFASREQRSNVPYILFGIATVLFYFCIKFFFMWKFSDRIALLPKIVGVFFGYIGASFIFVGSYMHANDLSIFGKDVWGSFPTKQIIITLPYLTAYRCIITVYRKFVKNEPIVTKVFDGWYIGGWIDSLTHLKDAGSDCAKIAILDLTTELPRKVFGPNIVYSCLPTFDRYVPSVDQITAAVQWCFKLRADGYDVVVHCAFGHGRSAAVLIACLLADGLTGGIDEMESDLKSLRPYVKLTGPQYSRLVAWTKKVPQLPFNNSPYILSFVKKAIEEEQELQKAKFEAEQAEKKAEAEALNSPISIEEIIEDKKDAVTTAQSTESSSTTDSTEEQVSVEAVDTIANEDQPPAQATSELESEVQSPLEVVD